MLKVKISIGDLIRRDNEANESIQTPKYVGVALVEAYYVSEFGVPAGVTSLKFIIQACGFDGASQELVDSLFHQLHVEGL
nr:cytosolic endo-beta-N-acetylglucosaminidase 1 isoform X1 [Tanacetum cinerariifolium]